MKKIPVKTLYLLLVIGIGLVGLGIGSTYAVFTTSAEIHNPISLNSNLTHDSDIIETIEVEVPAGETVSSTLNITNNSGSTLNYTVWYLDEGQDIEVGTSTDNVVGIIFNGNSVEVVVDILNNSSSDVKVILGISSSSDSVVLGSDMNIVPSELLTYNLIDYITDLYANSNPTLITHSKDDGTSDTYYYSYQDSSSTWGLMNDGLKVSDTYGAGATTITDTAVLTSGTEGNIRYFGPSDSVNNYIYFNCETYPDTNCELWRIIGIVDGKVKLIRSESIGNYSWDNKNTITGSEYDYGSNDWSDARLMRLLNPGYEDYVDMDNSGNDLVANNSLYWNSGSGKCYLGMNNAVTTCNFTSKGLKNDTTRNMISQSTWYLGGYRTTMTYPNILYASERTNTVGLTIYGDNSYTIMAKIGLMYSSDYGYGTDLTNCSSNLSNYDSSTNSYACRINNWLYTGGLQWLITPRSYVSYNTFYVSSSGLTGSDGILYMNYGVSPVLYLNSELSVYLGSDGSISNPYRLSVD